MNKLPQYMFKNKKLLTLIMQIAILISPIFEVSAELFLIAPDKAREVEIAKTGYTRFSFLNEKIDDAFIYPEHLAETIIHKSGFMLVLPSQALKNQAAKTKLYLTLIGENGTVQDIILQFNNKSPEPIEFARFNLENEIKNNIGEFNYE